MCKGMWCLNTAMMVSPHFKQFRFHRMSAVSIGSISPFYLHSCRNDRVRKNSLGSISIATSFRDTLPSPGEHCLVLFTMTACIYRYTSMPHIEFVKGIPTALEQDSHFDVNKRNLIVFDDQMIDASKDKRIVNLFTRGSHHRNLSETYIVRNLIHHGKGSRSISLNNHYLVLFRNPRFRFSNLDSGKANVSRAKWFLFNQYEEAVKRRFGCLLIDLKTTTQDNFRLRTNVLPSEEGQ